MNNYIIFVVGLAVTLVAGMGVITSQVFLGYKSYKRTPDHFDAQKVIVTK